MSADTCMILHVDAELVETGTNGENDFVVATIKAGEQELETLILPVAELKR